MGPNQEGIRNSQSDFDGKQMVEWVHGEDRHALGVLDVGTRVDGDNVTELDAEVVPDNAVHAH